MANTPKKPYIKPKIEHTEKLKNLGDEKKDILEVNMETQNNEVELKTTVMFMFNKNVRFGNIPIKKGEMIEINRQDAIVLKMDKHGEIIEIGD